MIKENLQKKVKQSEEEFLSLDEKHILIKKIYEDFKKFDFENYKKKLGEEIKHNTKEWWTNPDKGILNEEMLLSVLFEFDNYFLIKDVPADAYGINTWKDYSPKSSEFYMGHDYDFATNFGPTQGITLNFFDVFESLEGDFSKLADEDIEELDLETCFDLEGCEELIEFCKYKGFLEIHLVLKKLDENREFELLNYSNNFMFMIAEHGRDAFPLLIKNK